MFTYKEIDLDYQTRSNVLNIIDEVHGEPEMSEFESAFLTGVIKKSKPKKVLEIGVAAGGTTAIILDSLEKYSNEYVLFSLDLNDKFYRDKDKKTGFLAEQYKQIKPLKKGTHSLITGNYAPMSARVVGNQIDLIIIDTVHVLPGEILDFLAFYPYLSNDAFVVLHDTALNHKGKIKPNRAYATKLLFDVIKADKYINYDLSEGYLFPNIAAFGINQYTTDSIIDLLSSLTICWEYFPSEKEISLYTDVISNNYEPLFTELWNKVIEQQRRTMRPENQRHRYYYIDVKSGSIIHWLFLTRISTRYLLDNGLIALLQKIIERLKRN